MTGSAYFPFCFPAAFLLCLAVAPSGAQNDQEPIGFGDIQLGAPLATIPFPCNHPVACEAPDESTWMRIWHAEGRIWRIDVVYSGRPLDIDEEIRSSPISLAQAIRAHSIRYGHNSPRLGFAGDEAGSRVIVDTANSIAYFAQGMYPDSLVKEVRYLPPAHSLVAAASLSPLTERGLWLVKAARSVPRYKNLLGNWGNNETGLPPDDDPIPRETLVARLQTMSSQERSLAANTLLLSERVSKSLDHQEPPDPAVAEMLRKAVALLHATEREAASLLKDHRGAVTPEEIQALPLDLASQADSKMQELVRQGFSL
ncbi:MAG TPA: hypothetical protein VGL00_11075 [Terracidiphilus sp.]